VVTEVEEVKQLHEFVVLKRTIVAGIEVVGVDDKEDEVREFYDISDSENHIIPNRYFLTEKDARDYLNSVSDSFSLNANEDRFVFEGKLDFKDVDYQERAEVWANTNDVVDNISDVFIDVHSLDVEIFKDYTDNYDSAQIRHEILPQIPNLEYQEARIIIK
jgi:hypothetical protein